MGTYFERQKSLYHRLSHNHNFYCHHSKSPNQLFFISLNVSSVLILLLPLSLILLLPHILFFFLLPLLLLLRSYNSSLTSQVLIALSFQIPVLMIIYIIIDVTVMIIIILSVSSSLILIYSSCFIRRKVMDQSFLTRTYEALTKSLIEMLAF